MTASNVLDGFARLRDADIDGLDRRAIADLVSLSALLRAWHDSVDMRLARRTRELHRAGSSEGPESMFGRHGNRSSRESEVTAARSQLGADLPGFERDLADGRVASGHLDALANVRGRLDVDTRAAFDEHEHSLLAAAGDESVDAFTRRCRDLARRLTPARSDADELDRQRQQSNVKRWVDKITGMHLTRLELDPVRDAMLWNIVNGELGRQRQIDGNARTPWQQMQVNAFIAAVRGGTPEDATDGADGSVGTGLDTAPGAGPTHPRRSIRPSVPEITVLVDLETLRSGMHDHTICETDDGVALPVSTVRRLCCDADIVPAVLGTAGETLDVGRAHRTISRGQRRALRAMHRTCGHPECTVPFSACKIHHVRWWARDRGPTDIGNLLPLCEQHHHLVHEGRWMLTMTPERVVTWTRPDGEVHHCGCAIDRRATPDRHAVMGHP